MALKDGCHRSWLVALGQKSKSYLFLTFLLVSVQSCMFFGPVDETTMKIVPSEPNDSVMVGEWYLDHFSNELIRENYPDKLEPVRLNLGADHQFQAVQFPDFVADPFGKPRNGKMLNASGSWTCARIQHGWGLDLHFDHGELFPDGVLKSVDLFNNKNQLTIMIFIGDPDSGHRLLFRKMGTKGIDRMTPA